MDEIIFYIDIVEDLHGFSLMTIIELNLSLLPTLFIFSLKTCYNLIAMNIIVVITNYCKNIFEKNYFQSCQKNIITTSNTFYNNQSNTWSIEAYERNHLWKEHVTTSCRRRTYHIVLTLAYQDLSHYIPYYSVLLRSGVRKYPFRSLYIIFQDFLENINGYRYFKTNTDLLGLPT
ncbi:hypothetical protein ACJX0J_030300 [Zea mays]